MLREFGGIGQQRLASATVALVGMGGLGAPASLYLVAAGVGRLILIDDDRVELSNLQRQVLYTTNDLGLPKVQQAATRLQAIDPQCEIAVHSTRLHADNAQSLLAGADLVLDGSDSFDTRFAVNKACLALGVPLVSGAVGRWDGQVGVFCHGGALFTSDAKLACYQCWVPETPPDAEHCAQTGVIGALPGLIGTQMAMQAIKLLSGSGQPLLGRLWLHAGLNDQTRIVSITRDPTCPACGDH